MIYITSIKKDPPSRGQLITRFLTGNATPRSYLEGLKKDAGRYNGFNIILGWKDEIFYYSNKGKGIHNLYPGIYGLNNHLLDTPWPKVVKGKCVFTRLILDMTFMLIVESGPATMGINQQHTKFHSITFWGTWESKLAI